MKLNELLRKLIHVFFVAIPFSYRFVFNNNKKITVVILAIMALLVLAVEFIRLEKLHIKKAFYKIFGFMLRRKEVNSFTGLTYFLLASVICIAVLPANIAFCALVFLALGDAAAAIIGLRFGKRKIKGTNKTLEGSLACFCVTFGIALFYLPPFVAFCGAITAMITEIVPKNINDNLKIPLSSGLVMAFASILPFVG